VSAIGLAMFFVFKYYLDKIFEEGGLYLGKEFTFYSIAALLFAYLLFGIASFFNAKKGIYREF
jgi:hypothetical protein